MTELRRRAATMTIPLRREVVSVARDHRKAVVSGLASTNGHTLERLAMRRTEIRCAGCGYGGVVSRLPDRCPMCRGDAWEITGRRPSSLSNETEE
jgi:predicted Zn-ribbon and HTH transcriptional regulator